MFKICRKDNSVAPETTTKNEDKKPEVNLSKFKKSSDWSKVMNNKFNTMTTTTTITTVVTEELIEQQSDETEPTSCKCC